MKKLLFLFFLFLFAGSVYADSCEIYFFYSPTCPHCANEEVLLDQLQQKNPELKINRFVASNNYDLFKQMCEDHDSAPVGVPRTFIQDKVFIGFDEEEGPLKYSQGYKAYIGYENQIKAAIEDCLGTLVSANETSTSTGTCPEDHQPSIFLVPLLLLLLYVVFFCIFKRKIETRYLIGTFFGILIIILFYFSQHLPKESILSFARQFTFPVFTFIIAFLDGFNPCAFAVLAVLLSLLVYAKSRKKMALIGLIFIITSGVMYFLFIIILMLLRAEILGAYKEPIRIIVGIIAIVAGTINLKDFFFFKKGISLTISSEKMSKLVKKMRKIVDDVKNATTKKAMFIAILGTVFLAVLVNVIELGCTLILPIEYIEVLITNYGTQLGILHYSYTAFYSAVYIVPLLAILGVFLYSFKSMRVKEMHGRVLKLIGGLVMLGLGLILIFRPELLMFG
jgi:thiol-disulfide isomerase/thioredoxin